MFSAIPEISITLLDNRPKILSSSMIQKFLTFCSTTSSTDVSNRFQKSSSCSASSYQCQLYVLNLSEIPVCPGVDEQQWRFFDRSEERRVGKEGRMRV